MRFFANLTFSTSLILSSFMLFSPSASADTTFASVRSANEDGGSIIAKNRDSLSPHQHLAVKHEHGKHSFIGLFYNYIDKKPYPFLAAGVNQYGLSVVNLEAASLYHPTMFNDADQSEVMHTLLKNYSSIRDVMDDKDKLFGNGKANFLLIADQMNAILVEIGPKKGAFEIKTADHNHHILYHTNHYVLKPMEKFNKIFYADSQDRFKSISELMHKTPGKLTAEGHYYHAINSSHNGPFNSIFREITVASWVVDSPENGIPYLYARLSAPNEKYEHYAVELKPSFWSSYTDELHPYSLSSDEIEGEPLGSEKRYTYDDEI